VPVFLRILLALSADARAPQAPASSRYRMLQSILGEIGERQMTVRRDDDAIVVSTRRSCRGGRRAHGVSSHDPLARGLAGRPLVAYEPSLSL
jgi:hypothetical protein